MSVTKTVENVYLRQRAALLTRQFFWILLGMSVISYAITSGLEWLLTQLGDAWMAPEITAMGDAFQQYLRSETMTSTAPAIEATAALFTSPKFWGINLLHFVVTGLISTAVTLGTTLQYIEAARDNTPRIPGMFSRMRYCLKSWGLSLWIFVKTGLWMIPGFALVIVGAELQMYDFYTLGNWVSIAGVSVLFWLSIAAMLRYSQAVHIMTDEPDRGIRECVTFSTGLMKDRKWQFVRLCIPALLKAAGMFLLVNLIGSLLLSSVALDTNYIAVQVCSLLSILSMVYFLMQRDMVCALFYLKRRDPDFAVVPEDAAHTSPLDKPEAISDKPVSYWLRDHTVTDIAPAEASPTSTEEAEKENPHEQPDC